MANLLYEHLDEVTALVLFGVGFTLLLVDKNLIKKVIGFSMMDSGIYLFLASYGYIESRLAPIYVDGVRDPKAYVNPLPAGLVLTGIVVGVRPKGNEIWRINVPVYLPFRNINSEACFPVSQMFPAELSSRYGVEKQPHQITPLRLSSSLPILPA